MNGFKMMFGQTKRFYLVLLLVMILYIMMDCIYICNDFGVVSLGEKTIEQMEESLLTQDAVAVFESNCISLARALENKGENFELFNLGAANCFVILILLIRNFIYTDIRMQEFRSTWPVKKWVREVYDYLVIGISLGIAFWVQLVLLLVAQTRYNHKLIDFMGENADRSAMENLVSASNQELAVYMICFYVIPVIMTYAWLSFGISLTKNPVLGAGIAMAVKVGFAFLGELASSNILSIRESAIYTELSMKLSGNQYDLVEVWLCTFRDSEIFNYSNEWFRSMTENYSEGMWNAGVVNAWLIAKVSLIVVLSVGIIFAAGKKELSKGKFLYFPTLDYPLSILIGLFCFAWLQAWYAWLPTRDAFLISLVIAVVSCRIIHPFSGKRSERLEVK